MNSNLSAETGSLDPGLDQLFRTLTSGPAAGELAGEQAALAMFRENRRPPASPAKLRGRFLPGRWGVRMAAVAALLLGGGTAAAYAAVLPTPVQRLAHDVFQFAGVPPANNANPTPTSQPSHPTGHHGSAPGHGGKPPGPALKSPRPTGQASTSPSTSASPPATAPAQLSAVAASSPIAAGSDAVIDGQLTRSGNGVAGATVTLLERTATQLRWHVAGSGQTNAAGNLAVTVSGLTTNAVFRLTIRGTVHSADVRVTVVPPITATLNVGTGGVQDVLVVTTQYANSGNVVLLQVQSAGGGWSDLRAKTLNSAGQVSFAVSGKRLKNQVLRVKLVATARHGVSVSNPVTVPPPS